MDPEDASPCLVAARYIVLLIRGPQRRIQNLWNSGFFFMGLNGL